MLTVAEMRTPFLLCSSRGGATKTIKTGCDTIEAGSATNKVGATSATDVDACVAGTYARAGAAQCLPVSRRGF